MKGWIIDCYPDYEHDCIVIWMKTNKGVERLVDKDFFPKFYVHAAEEKLTKLADDLTMFDVRELTLERKKTWLGEKEKLTLGVTIDKYRSLSHIARMVSRWGEYGDYSLYNVDLRFEQRYFLTHDLIHNTSRGEMLQKKYGGDDLVGHAAIRDYFELQSGVGENWEQTDFSKPTNFPVILVKAIKRGDFRGLGEPKGLLTAPAGKAYQEATDTYWDLFSEPENRVEAWR